MPWQITPIGKQNTLQSKRLNSAYLLLKSLKDSQLLFSIVVVQRMENKMPCFVYFCKKSTVKLVYFYIFHIYGKFVRQQNIGRGHIVWIVPVASCLVTPLNIAYSARNIRRC